MDLIGKYIEKPFSKNREMIIDVIELGLLKHHVQGFIEVDVTEARRQIKKYRNETGKGISFTGWIAKCISQAVSENKEVHAIRKGKRKVIIFSDVDILITVESMLNGEKIPLPYIIRKVNEKSVMEINTEIRNAQTLKLENNTMVIGKSSLWMGLYQLMPKFIRRFVGYKISANPMLMKKNVGTIGISSIGMKGNFRGWMKPISPQPLYFALGGITKKPGVIDDKIEIREYINVAFIFDHDIIDGASMARFIEQLVNLMENAYELEGIV
jgi:pyruvate/2-oxoglutarate dehydrogenase complex dihydrolipoamide acyltransferase (E2) component